MNDTHCRSVISNLVRIVLSILACLNTGFSQVELDPILFDQLSIDHGLSHNTVNCLLQDSHGYIWIGTHNGLNQYDGYGFRIYGTDNEQLPENGFVGRDISALFEDQNQTLWVGTRKQGINIKRKFSDRFENLRALPAIAPLAGYSITSINEDASGNIWITSLGNGILKYDPVAGTSVHYTPENSGLSSPLVFDLVEDRNGVIWAAAAGLSLNVLTEERFELAHEPQPNQPNMAGYRKKLYLQDSVLWICTEGTGLYRMRIEDRAYTRFSEGENDQSLNSNAVRDIFDAGEGNLLIATDGGGLNIYHEPTGLIRKYQQQYRESNSLNSNALFCFLGDRTGNIWIGTYNGGVNIHQVNKTRFDFFSPETGRGQALQSPSILSLFQTRDNKVWIGTDGGGLFSLDRQTDRIRVPPVFSNSGLPSPFTGEVIKTIFEDSRGRLWIGTFGNGLFIYDPDVGTLYRAEELISLDPTLGPLNVWSITERKNGDIWIGVIGLGVIVYNNQAGNHRVIQPIPGDTTSLAEPNIMVLFTDSSDRIWVGTGDNGLQLWDEKQEGFQTFQHDRQDTFSVSNNEIRAIFEDSKGNIWIGTESGGLNRWLGQGKFAHMMAKDGLIANSVMGIVEDPSGMLWISSFDGISRLNPENNQFRNFEFYLGETNNQFNQMAILCAHDGRLFFGGINGLHTLNPERLRADTVSPNILFTELRVFNKKIFSGPQENGKVILEKAIEDAESLRLSYGDNSFSIDFAAMDFSAPLSHIFSYKMEGFDDDWRLTSRGDHRAYYTNLEPGSYQFRVLHEGREASLAVIIEPPFWKTSWFRFLLSLGIIGVIALGLVLIIKRREALLKSQMLDAEGEILKLRNENLKAEVGAKNSKLIASAAQMAHKNEVLAKLLSTLKEDKTSNHSTLIRTLKHELKNEDYWNEFNQFFNQIDTHFVQSLAEEFPALTSNDLRICTLLRINMSTKEIASLLNITVRGAEQSRYRLKKRLELTNEDNLVHFISSYQPRN